MSAKELDSFKWPLAEEDCSYFRKCIERIAGISLKETKIDLISSRLRKRAVQLGLKTLHEYRLHLESVDEHSPEWQFFINQLTTNKTDFFREPDHFDYLLKQFLPAWLKHGKRKLNIWSCASSTGEEPYTLAMVLEKALPSGIDYSILATDIDTEVLALAKNGVYSKHRLHEIPGTYHDCLAFGTGEVKEWFAIRKTLREKIIFLNHNLMQDDLPVEEKFDLVFCRNVLIYFNPQGIEITAKKIFNVTNANGVLVIGHSESLQGKKGQWRMGRPSYYFKS